MKKRIADLLKNKKRVAATFAGVMVAAVIGGTAFFSGVPELTSHVDPIMEVSLEEEETPLAAKPKVTTKTTKKTNSKKVKLKSASTKTYTKKLPTTKKTTTKKKNTTSATITTQTTVATATTEKYVKKSKYKTVNQVITTTVKTTTVAKANTSTTGGTAQTTAAAAQSASKGTIDVMSAASKMDPRVLKAFTTLGFTVKYDNSVSYSGYYDTKNRSITLRANDETIYHELGHFLSFIAGNVDTSKNFVAVYNKEKGKYTGVNKAYVLQDSSEYFAESVKDYTLNPSALQASRPETYKAVKAALDKVTDAQVMRIKVVYGKIWK